MKKNWKKTREYEEILRILDDYWIDEPKALEVSVEIKVLYENGIFEDKHIRWYNPAVDEWEDAQLAPLGIGPETKEEKMEHLLDSIKPLSELASESEPKKFYDDFGTIRSIKRRVETKTRNLMNEFNDSSDSQRKADILQEVLKLRTALIDYDK